MPENKKQRVLVKTIKMVAVEKLTPHPRNPNKHPAKQLKALAKIIGETGWRLPIIVSNLSGYIVAGHARLEVALMLGHREVPVSYQDFADENEEMAFLLADNRIPELSKNDEGALSSILLDLSSADYDVDLTGYDTKFVARLADKYAAGQPNKSAAASDDLKNLQAKWGTKLGQLWRLGDHRLVCGDSTNTKDVQRLLGRDKPMLMVTDPPYGVNYDPAWRNEADKGVRQAKLGKVQNDDRADWSEAWALFPGNAAYVWHACLFSAVVGQSLIANGFELRSQIIWAKDRFALSRGHYHWQHEPCAMPGTLVTLARKRTTRGPEPPIQVPVENLKDGDCVVSWDGTKVHQTGRPIRVRSREYDGQEFTVSVGDNQTSTTHNHHWSVRTKSEGYVTYIMRKGDWWRIGYVKVRSTNGFGPTVRMKKEGADDLWILRHHKTARSARVWESAMSAKYGVPQTHWSDQSIYHGKSSEIRGQCDIQEIYDIIGPRLWKSAFAILMAHGRDPQIPLARAAEIKSKGKKAFFSKARATIVRSCNLVPGVFQIPQPTNAPRAGQDSGQEGFVWRDIQSIKFRDYKGLVYSLDVPGHHHYVADGLVTHNCHYATKTGAYWSGDRSQSTLWTIPARDDGGHGHGTQKPIECMRRPMENSSKPGDLVYEPFCGSGTTILAAEQIDRKVRAMEIDPQYVAVILERWTESGGKKPRLSK